MTRGKDEEKMSGPMFPRLHVNDSEKGGPRAPPRNKMALYEQLSIPSQRFNQSMLPNNTGSNGVPPLSQGTTVNDRSMFFSRLLPGRHQYGMRYSKHSDLCTPPTQIEPIEKSDEDDYSVPIFIHSLPSQERGKHTDIEKFASSDPSCFGHSLKPQEAKETSILEGKTQQRENFKQFVGGIVNVISNSVNPESMNKQITSSTSRKQGDKSDNFIERINVESRSTSNRQISAILEDNRAAMAENIVHDLSNVTESHDDGSCGSRHICNLERDDTPDDVVAMIGQKHFWKARRAISNQQRVFSIQVFELHRLIKVQRLMAASPNILFEESAYLRKPLTNDSPVEKLLVSEVMKIPKQKCELDKAASQKKEGSAENIIVEKTSCAQNVAHPPCPVNSEHNYARPLYLNNQQLGNQWLIPVMSPSEGLVYKPYPVDPACGGLNPGPAGNFFTPPTPYYGLQYQQPFPQGYFNPYAMMMPMMSAEASLSVSSVEQIKRSPMLGQKISGGNFGIHHENAFNLQQASSDMDVQGSTASSPSERIKGANVLPLFPTSPPTTTNSSTLEAPTRVIKVVPHNATTANESAARIFQSIQEERKHYDSV